MPRFIGARELLAQARAHFVGVEHKLTGPDLPGSDALDLVSQNQ